MTAEKDKDCSNCPQQDSCQSIYEKMGKKDGPNVTYSVILVFMLPVLVFIASLIICSKVFNLSEKSGFTILISTIVTILYILLASYLVRKITKKQKNSLCNTK